MWYPCTSDLKSNETIKGLTLKLKPDPIQYTTLALTDTTTTTATILWPFVRDYPGDSVPER